MIAQINNVESGTVRSSVLVSQEPSEAIRPAPVFQQGEDRVRSLIERQGGRRKQNDLPTRSQRSGSNKKVLDMPQV